MSSRPGLTVRALYGVNRFLKMVLLFVVPLVEELIARLAPYTAKSIDLANTNLRLNQMQMVQHYRVIREGRAQPLSFRDVEFRAYSQNGEDGILLYILSLLGIENGGRCIEICCGTGMECNTANLIVNHGWSGFLVDGDTVHVKRARAFFRRRAPRLGPPKVVACFVTAENVNSILADNGFERDIELLSLDMDGNDYWVLKSLAIEPKVIVLEYNNVLGPDLSITMPYVADFPIQKEVSSQGAVEYTGASLRAFTKLCKLKGYRLVGCESSGFNAFFVRQGLAEDHLPEIDVTECFRSPNTIWAMQHRWPLTKDLEWVEV